MSFGPAVASIVHRRFDFACRSHPIALGPDVGRRHPIPRNGSPLMPGRNQDVSTWTDSELISSCQKGNARAWRALVDRYRRLVYGIPRIQGLGRADAEEVFQIVFTELIGSLGRLRDPDSLGAWLSTTARRTAQHLHSRERRRNRLHTKAEWVMDPDPPDSGQEAIERLEERERVRRALDSLGDPCRTLLLGLFADPPRSYRELARELDLAIGSLGPTRARCLARLRRNLEWGKTPGPGRAVSKPDAPKARR